MSLDLDYYLISEGNGGTDYNSVKDCLLKKKDIRSVMLVGDGDSSDISSFDDLAIFWRYLANKIKNDGGNLMVCFDYVPSLPSGRNLRQGYITMARYLRSLENPVPAITHIDVSLFDREMLEDCRLKDIVKHTYVLAPSKTISEFINPQGYDVHPELVNYVEGNPNNPDNVADALVDMGRQISKSRDLGNAAKSLESAVGSELLVDKNISCFNNRDPVYQE